MPPVTVRPLRSEEIDAAFGLLRHERPALDPEGWRRYAETLLADPDGGALVAAAPRCLFGLAAFAARPCPRVGRCLTVDPLVTMEVLGGGPLRAALLEALGGVAARLRCRSIEHRLPLPLVETRSASLTEDGYVLASSLYRRALERDEAEDRDVTPQLAPV